MNVHASTFFRDESFDQEGVLAERDPDRSILLIYTGGTIGATPSDPNDPESPLDIAKWPEFSSAVPELDRLRSQYQLRIDAESLDVPLDSTNLTPDYWVTFADIVHRHYESYRGFVLLHGTDTMVYTASALSFMLDGLAKPVVLTGSQVPILHHPHTDGSRNLVNAIRVAAAEVCDVQTVPEVCIAFDKVLLRGNRSRKKGADTFEGFDSPNLAPLGKLEDKITVRPELIHQTLRRGLRVRKDLDTSVLSIQIFPGIQTGTTFADMLGLDVRGVVLQAYGSGNAPATEAVLDPLAKAITEEGKLVVDVTQCFSGTVRLGEYGTDVGLLRRGVLNGADITPEAALCKLMVALGSEQAPARRERLMQQATAGEQSSSVYRSRFIPLDESGNPTTVTIEGGAGSFELPQATPAELDTSWIRERRIASVFLYLEDAILTPADGADVLSLKVYVDGQLASTTAKSPVAEPDLMLVNISDCKSRLQAGDSPYVSVEVVGEGSLTFARASFVVMVDEAAKG